MSKRPDVNSEGQRELDKVDAQLQSHVQKMESIDVNKINNTQVQDFNPQTKMSNREVAKADAIYLIPDRAMPCRAKFNEDYRKEYEYYKQPVRFVAENKEIIGETIEIWTKKYAGVPYEFWKVPTNRVVVAPRYLAERLADCKYRRIVMKEDKITGTDGMGSYFGRLEAEQVVSRFDARPAGNSFISMAS
jgi:hypothetical protein